MSSSAASLHAVLASHAPAGLTGFVVAVSGGADSAALLAAMVRFCEDSPSVPLRAVHIDHGLQSAAAEFNVACSRLCAKLKVPLRTITVTVDTRAGASIEAAARAARYAALAAQLQPDECLLTAHHRQDQAETLVLQALRGAGVKGMSAMAVCRRFGVGWHLRPALGLARSELLKFGEQLEQVSATDPMNQDLRFDRAFLRSQIWPPLEKRWPGAEIALSRAARHMAEAQELLDSCAAADLGRLRDGEALSIPGLRSLSMLRRMNALRLWLGEAQLQLPSRAHLGEVLRQVLEAQADRMPAIRLGPKALRRYRHRLFLTDAQPPRLEDRQSWIPALNPRLELGRGLGHLTLVPRIGGLKLEALPASLVVRRRAGGETLKPGQSASTQSVQHLCQSLGVLPWMRGALPLLYAGDALIAVADLWLDARFCSAAQAGVALEWRDGPLYV